MEPTDEFLMKAHREGDPSAFSDLVHRYHNPLFGYLMRMLHHRELAEDCLQETFLRVHKKGRTYRTGAKFKSWLFTIATRIAIDTLRKNRRALETQSLDHTAPVEAPAASPDEEAVRSETRETIRAAVESLPPKQRAALILSYYQGHTYSEVADIMGCSLGTIKTHMSRALKKLATILPAPEGGSL